MSRFFVALSICYLARGETFIDASDSTHVLWRGRSYPGGAPGSVAYQWLGASARVAFTGSYLRVQVAKPPHEYKLATYQFVEGYHAYQTTTLVAFNDSILLSTTPGIVTVSLNVPADYWAQSGTANGEGAIISFSTDGSFLPAPVPAASRTLHILGDSITAATNVHGSITKCADGGYQADYFSSWGGQVANYFDADATVVAVVSSARGRHEQHGEGAAGDDRAGFVVVSVKTADTSRCAESRSSMGEESAVDGRRPRFAATSHSCRRGGRCALARRNDRLCAICIPATGSPASVLATSSPLRAGREGAR